LAELETHVEKCTACLERLDQLSASGLSLSHFLLNDSLATPKTEAIKFSEVVAPGDMVGEYRILSEIGRGGLGAVFRCQHPRLEQQVAIKLLRRPDVADLGRLHLEGRLLTRMSHPNVARVFDFGNDNGRLYLVMELIEGDSLSQYCDGHRLSIRDRLRIFAQLCHGVQHAHQKGVIHRDLKPSNVLVADLDGQPTAKIIDFGISKDFADPSGDETLPGMLIGTPHYMSPEQASLGASAVDARSDLFSLGAILYELMIGETPFANSKTQSIMEVLHAIGHDEPQPAFCKLQDQPERLRHVASLRNVPPATLLKQLQHEPQWIIDALLAKDPNQRYDSAASLARDVEKVLDGQDISVGPPSRAYRMKRWIRRHPAATLGVTSLIGLLIFSSIGYVIVRSSLVREMQFKQELASSLVLIEAAQKDTLLALERESVANKSSQARFQQTKDVINNFYLQFAENAELQTPRMLPLRKQLLQQALGYYSELASAGDDDSFLEEVELAYRRMAEILRVLGEHSKCLAAVERALEYNRRLGDSTLVKIQRADIYSVQAFVLKQLRQNDESLQAYEQAASTLDHLHTQLDSDDEQWVVVTSKLSSILQSKALVYRLQHELQNAKENFDRALELRGECMARQTNDPRFWRQHASLMSDIANWHSLQGQSDEALRYLELGEESIAKAQLVSTPTASDEQWLAKTAGNRSVIFQADKKHEAASASLRKAIDHFEKLIVLDPVTVLHRADNAKAYRFYAATLADSGMVEEAGQQLFTSRDNYQLAWELSDKDLKYRRDLAKSEYELGKYLLARDRREESVLAFDTAIEHFSEVVLKSPQDGYAWMYLKESARLLVRILKQSDDSQKLEKAQAHLDQVNRLIEDKVEQAEVKLQLIETEDLVYKSLFWPTMNKLEPSS
jgi:serine/threonine protein kinase